MKKQLTGWRKLMYGSGDLGLSMTSTIVAAYFAIFLINVVGIPAKVAAIVIFVGKSWDYINDPLFGYLSDRTRTRWGRRRPYLLFGPIPFAIIYAFMWWKPPFHSNLALIAYYAVLILLYDASATLIYMPFFALTPELTD